MANHKKAALHHDKAGECLSKGDTKGAAHHMGHALAALRGAADESSESGEGMAEDAPAPTIGIRDRLKKFGAKK